LGRPARAEEPVRRGRPRRPPEGAAGRPRRLDESPGRRGAEDRACPARPAAEKEGEAMTRLVLAFTAAVLLVTPARAAEKPNAVIILADDLGYGDVSCYNPDRGKIPTPHIDALAREGMRFTDGHSSSAVCSPTRYSLLTGRYHWRTRLQQGIVGVWGAPLIAPGRPT